MTGARGHRAPTRLVRRPLPRDREEVATLLRATERFSAAEVDVALELFDAGVGTATTPATDPSYQWFVAAPLGGFRIEGFACYGETPMTDGAYDLYWIAVHPDAQGSGTGGLLLRAVEDEVLRAGGRAVIVETSSRDDYGAARIFYVKHGYHEAARIRDFYAVGDDRLTLFKVLGAEAPHR